MIVKRKTIHFRWGPKLFRVVSQVYDLHNFLFSLA